MFQTPIENRTPFVAMPLPVIDRDGQEVLLVVMAATFQAPIRRELQIADEQSPIRVADVYRGNPISSSTEYEADVAVTKPLIDVLVNGHAYASGGSAQRVVVQVQIGDINKTLMVTGDRDRFGRASPFRTMPIIYERAYGGGDANGALDQRNPVGVGFRGAVSADPEVKTTVPNIEYQSGAPQPAGFGIVGRGWKPRIDFAGTYDQRWLDTRWPLLPTDFDPRHNQAAPLDQQTRTLRGGEDAEIVNMTPNGRWRFRVPMLDVPVHLIYEDRFERTRLVLDTVLIEPDRYTVTLTARLSIPTIRNAAPLREVVLGHVTRGWIRARTTRKSYIDHSGRDGSDRFRSSVRL